MCFSDVLAPVTLAEGNEKDNSTPSPAIPPLDLDVNIAMPHGPVKDSLAAGTPVWPEWMRRFKDY